jgi:germination protein M
MVHNYRQVHWFGKVGKVVVIGLLVISVSGCSLLKSKGESQSIDPPPVNANLANDGTGVSSTEKSSTTAVDESLTQASKTAAAKTQVTLYYKDSFGFVAPISIVLPNTEQIAKQSLEYMVEDGPGQSLLPAGFTALLPKGTQIKGINIVPEQKLAVVDFSNAFSNYNAQDERKIMEAVVWTLTGFPSIEKVQFHLEGKAMNEMPVFNTPLAEPLSRKMGINLEVATGVNIGQSTPVTLYFHNETAAQFGYYVPVTRMINRTDQPNAAVMEQLIQGPIGNKGLSATVTASTKISNIQQSEDQKLITVDFANGASNSNESLSPEALEAIILSITESSGASMVQFTVNGEKKIAGEQSQIFSKPVSRPAHINPLKV